MVVYGGKGALGAAIVDYFKSYNWVCLCVCVCLCVFVCVCVCVCVCVEYCW